MQNETKRLPYRDPVLTDGLLAAPLAVFCEDFAHGLASAFMLAAVMLIAVPLTALVPRKLPLSVRILFYSAVCALVYIPAALFAATLFPTVSGGIWMPVIALMPAMTVCRDRYFGGKGMFRNLLRTVLTVSLLMTVFGAVRELLGTGTLSGRAFVAPPLPFILTPAGGMLLLCCLCIARVYLPKRIRKEAEDRAAG